MIKGTQSHSTLEADMTRTIFFVLFLFKSISANCDLFASSANISQQCLTQMKQVCNDRDLNLKFFDASSKFLTSGMSYSEVIDLGNFPECLAIESNQIYGKFCALSLFIVDVWLIDATVTILDSLGIDTSNKTPQIISENQFREIEASLKDVLLPEVPFVVSKYSSCVPNACTPREVGLFYWYGSVGESLSLMFYNDFMQCETRYSNTDYEAGDIAVITFFSFILALIVACSFYEFWCENFKQKPYHPILFSFSLRVNCRKLLQITGNTSEEIQVFNGMRFLSMMWVVAYHADIAYASGAIPLVNFPEAKAWNSNLSNRYVLSGLLAVDTFFFISGFLLAYSYLRKSSDESLLEQILKIPKMYLHRYLRLTPSVGAMFLVTITIYRFLGAGPAWSSVCHLLGQTCRDKWWKFFLYIQNYTDPDDMCINPTWYLSADMQMFILAPLVLIPVTLFIKKRFKVVLYSLTFLIVLSILIPMILRYFVDEAAGNIYTAHERFNNFLIGITFGAIMRLYKHKPFIFSPRVNLLLWVVVLVVSLAFNLYWFDVFYNYSLLKYTLFMGLYRPVWCLCLVFMVYSCYHNQGGIIQWFLTLPSFQVLGRLAYSMYVLHVLVEVYSAGTTKTLKYFSNYLMFYQWCGHMIVTMVLSVVWVLAFEYPMLTIDKYLLGDRRKKTQDLKL